VNIVGLIAQEPAEEVKVSELWANLLDPWALIQFLVMALVIAWIAGRLLGGTKRSWKAVFITAVSGWLVALAVSATIVRGDLDHPSWPLIGPLMMLLFIMLATVVYEVWAKPGKRRVPPGLSIPHPIRLIKRRYRLTRRLAEITRIAARHGLGGFIGIRRSRAVGAEPTVAVASRIRRALEEAGGMFVKLGQLAAGRADLIGEEVAAEFAKLQDAVPAASPDEVRALVEEELGRPIEEVFSEFEWQPVGAASIGQAHLARLVDGSAVIVKVQRPGIAELVDRDLQIVAHLAALAEVRTTWGPVYGVKAFAREFSDNLRQELDYRVEANNAAQIAAVISHLDLIHVPAIDRTLSTSRIMVMELLNGVPLSQVDRRTELGVDRDRLAGTILRASVEPMFNGDRFHADPHPGNVFLLADGRLGLVDFGATGRLDAFEQAAVTDIMMGLQIRDPELLREAVLSVGTLRKEVDGRALERSFARFMAKHVSPGIAPTTAMLNELLHMLAFFGILLPASTSAMFRALVTLEGTINTIRPGFPIIDAAQQVGGDLVREHLGKDSLKEMAQEEAFKLAPVLRRAPRHFDRIATMVQQGEITGRVSLFSTQHDLEVVKSLLGRMVLAFVGASLMLLSVLLIGTDAGPTLNEETSLLQVFGYIGLLLGLILILRVTLAALRDTEQTRL
jgi:ubiquinone biosynthesis protein